MGRYNLPIDSCKHVHRFDQHTSTEYSSPRPITATYVQNIPHPGQSDYWDSIIITGSAWKADADTSTVAWKRFFSKSKWDTNSAVQVPSGAFWQFTRSSSRSSSQSSSEPVTASSSRVSNIAREPTAARVAVALRSVGSSTAAPKAVGSSRPPEEMGGGGV
eukprot:90128-Prorocentrum_minimum.AAC.1